MPETIPIIFKVTLSQDPLIWVPEYLQHVENLTLETLQNKEIQNELKPTLLAAYRDFQTVITTSLLPKNKTSPQDKQPGLRHSRQGLRPRSTPS
ncbi:hypothetical protein RB213_004788, partial [Colletotrichum asianum]